MDTKFISIIGHQNVAENGSKFTLYYLEVEIDQTAYVVQHRYQDFKDLFNAVRRFASSSPRVQSGRLLSRNAHGCAIAYSRRIQVSSSSS